jgi:hypothetical protein
LRTAVIVPIVGNTRNWGQQACAFLEKDRDLAYDALATVTIHLAAEIEREQQAEQAREEYQSRPAVYGGRMPPSYTRHPWTPIIGRRILRSRPEFAILPGHVSSALSLLPYPDVTHAGVMNAMHNICLGVNKTLIRRVIMGGEYKDKQRPLVGENGQTDSELAGTSDDGLSSGQDGFRLPLSQPAVARLTAEARQCTRARVSTSSFMSQLGLDFIQAAIRTVSTCNGDRLAQTDHDLDNSPFTR